VHRKTYNLDVISSLSRSYKCTKIVGGWGFAPDPTGGAYFTLTDPLTGFKGSTFKAPTSKGRGSEGIRGKGMGEKETLK